MESYANGDVAPRSAPSKAIPEFAWLRAHYRHLSQQADFESLGSREQWERLVQEVLDSPAATLWKTPDAVPDRVRPEILRWLQRTSNLAPRQLLTLRAIAHIGKGPDLQVDRRAFQYEVLGLPAGEEAWIADFDGGWRIIRVTDGQQGPWSEPHLTKDDALDTLARTLSESDPDWA